MTAPTLEDPPVRTRRSGSGPPPRAQVAAVQRARIVAAAAATIAEVGYPQTTVSHLVARARVSRKTFYEVFSDREDCFLAVFDECIERVGRALVAASAVAPSWQERVRLALARLLELMAAEPVLARLCVVDALAAGERVQARRGLALAAAAAEIDRGREQAPPGWAPPPLAAELLVGGVLSVLHTSLTRSAAKPAEDLLGPLASMIVLPYLGAEAAAELARRPSPGERDGPAPTAAGGDPLAGLGMRLTYRTLRVLVTIAAQPGASNRQIAAAAGIVDQGQMSKLLSRLRGVGLIANHGQGAASGGANAWRLTARGTAVVGATGMG